MEENEKAEQTEAEKIVAGYRAKYGERVEKVLAEVLGEIKLEMDGDAMALLHEQLTVATKIIRERLSEGQVVQWPPPSDNKTGAQARQ